MRKGENVLCIVLFCGSIVLLFYSLISFRTVGANASAMAGAWWPRLLLVGITLLSGILLKNQLRSTKSVETSEKEDNITNQGLLSKLIAACFIYAIAMNYAGFLISTLFYIAIVLFLLGLRNKRSLTILSLGITAMLFIIFVKILQISVPRGVGLFMNFSRIFY